MSPELDKQLCEKYPKIFANRHGDMQSTAMCWGIECGDGWYDLIDNLCSHLQWDTDHNNNAHAGKDGKYPQIVASQVKEKFGTLRFYVESSTDVQDAVIAFAEQLSCTICDVCGAKGKPNNSGWIKTRCDEHTDA